MSKAQFGDSFFPDGRNRMDVLVGGEKLPEYIQFGRELRKRLRQSVAEEGWPPPPENLHSLEEFFGAVRDTVSDRWRRVALPRIEEQCAEWAEHADAKAAGILRNPTVLEQKLEIRQFGVLENLRTSNPEAWRSLVVASSERQLAAIVLAQHWASALSEGEYEKIGITARELEIFIDSAGILGKYFDQAYIKQIELADAPGGSMATPLGDTKGAERIYDLPRPDGGLDLKPYAEVFPYEWPAIEKRMRALAEKVDEAFRSGQLPGSYRELGSFMRCLADAYGLRSADLSQVAETWNALHKEMEKLADDGCPIMFMPQGTASVAGDAEKVDAELRIGFRTPELQREERSLDAFLNFANALQNRYADAMDDPREMPKVFLNFQPFAFGPNIFWMTRAELAEESIVSHVNAIADVTESAELPLVKRVFGATPPAREYQKYAVTDTALHEVAHAVLPEDDALVRERIGVGSEASIIDELKAEAVGAFIVYTQRRAEGVMAEELSLRLMAKLGTNLDYIANKSDEVGSAGERYFYTGIAIIDTLLQEGVILRQGDRYAIVDPEKGFQALSKLGEKLLRFYADPKTTPVKMKQLGRSIRKKKDAKEIKAFVDMVRTRLDF